ncbi:MAG: ABC transporter ATP-binding protein [Deltaproteobacteria bacterium]|nr:ABC transporter ATP-binding protein [Deltaproteobacteria bacterium]MBW1978883.1 ABC transporter ATP-binding protein [Deltaproteobacteria bacterium]MBW2045370.1 ABC transporter ATP-binding protein [Deltaproteobacteria bacterium]MBW2299170.1 ABC transporter ATP-binding protein [Deltaproteobacteria bacterium]
MIEVKDLQKSFAVKETFFSAFTSLLKKKEKRIRAVNGISFSIHAGEIMGVAGESGCGKTTTAMLLLGLYRPSGGKVLFEGMDISSLKGTELRYFRRKAQLIFQDPYESLNPRFTVYRTIEEPLIVNRLRRKSERREKIMKAMEKAKLMPLEAFCDKYPHELSGGERQRVCIARAIVLEPVLLIADEATSMLDVSIRAGILEIIKELTEEMKMATLYISHDMSLLGSICDKIGIMYAGEIVEIGRSEDIIQSPLHPYTRALIEAVPVPEFRRAKLKLKAIAGEPPDLVNLPRGCSFRLRCERAIKACRTSRPKLFEVKQGHFVACHQVGD